MVLLADYNVFKKAFVYSNNSLKIRIVNSLYNKKNKICLSNEILSIIEEKVIEKDLFQAFIKEASDDNRIVMEKSSSDLSFYDQIIEIYDKSKIEFIIPLSLNSKAKFKNLKHKTILLDKVEKLDKNWIVSEILEKDNCSVCFDDFNDNDEIKTFFDNVFDIPKFMRSVYIFNREKDSTFLNGIKGNHISYFTILTDLRRKRHIYIDDLRDLKSDLGGKLKLFFTGNKRILHERKIIINSLIISSDNSFKNLDINEPTWEINISYNSLKSIQWKKKCREFSLFRA